MCFSRVLVRKPAKVLSMCVPSLFALRLFVRAVALWKNEGFPINRSWVLNRPLFGYILEQDFI